MIHENNSTEVLIVVNHTLRLGRYISLRKHVTPSKTFSSSLGFSICEISNSTPEVCIRVAVDRSVLQCLIRCCRCLLKSMKASPPLHAMHGVCMFVVLCISFVRRLEAALESAIVVYLLFHFFPSILMRLCGLHPSFKSSLLLPPALRSTHMRGTDNPSAPRETCIRPASSG
jgi:hypothetical protein